MAPTLYTVLAASTLLTASLAAPWRGNNGDYYPRYHHGSSTSSASSCGPTDEVDTVEAVGTAETSQPQTWHQYTDDQLRTLAPQMPTLEGLASNTNVTLFAPALGIGNQNYTCNGTNFVQTESASGATAQLYDLTELLMGGQTDVATIAQQSTTLRQQSSLPHLGLHYFSDDNVPVFNLTQAPGAPVLAGKKIGSVKAPAAEADIPWLFLLDAGNGVSKKLNTVYRIDTDKGVQDEMTCSEAGQVVERPYAAQYWFYY